MRVAASLMMLALSPVAALAQNSIATGSINPNTSPAVIVAVTGAPGDGNTALADAVRRILSAKAISDQASGSPYHVRVQVSVSPIRDGNQRMRIVWEVSNSRGKNLGEVAQFNVVKPGELDGEWGSSADTAAKAGVQGLVRLLSLSKG